MKVLSTSDNKCNIISLLTLFLILGGAAGFPQVETPHRVIPPALVFMLDPFATDEDQHDMDFREVHENVVSNRLFCSLKM